jgi:integrase
MVASMLSKLPEEGYLFPARGTDGPFNGWSKCKVALDRAVISAGCQVGAWTLHDLRRTFATNLAALGVPPHITERLLNHVTGTISGVAAIYNRHAYTDEMREAVSKWETQLSSLVAP